MPRPSTCLYFAALLSQSGASDEDWCSQGNQNPEQCRNKAVKDTVLLQLKNSVLKEKKLSQDPVPESPLSGVFPAPDGRLKLIMAQDMTFPPHAHMTTPPESDFHLSGVGYDMIHGMGDLCNWDVTVVQTPWANCWEPGAIGSSLLNGVYNGCMTYTHTVGERNRFVEFSHAVLKANKPAGIITRLDENGAPVIDGNHNLEGINVVDVTGWAPTADTLAVGMNDCTNTRFAGFNMLPPVGTVEELAAMGKTPNDAALEALLDGRADAMWLYADQGYNFRANQTGVTPSWNQELWSRFGQPNGFAYIHTGMLEHSYNGTTISMSKKGSGLAAVINPCLKEYLQTEDYYDVCVKHHVKDSCYPNSFFPAGSDPVPHVYELSTPLLAAHEEGGCSHGYCPCPVAE